MNHTHHIAGIGELLWDIFPDGARLGGAPTNFAFHSHQLGAQSVPVSAIGNDDLGERTIDELTQRGVSADYVQTCETHATGQVNVSLDSAGKPSYNILEDMAWDHLAYTPALQTLAKKLDAVCFGSLSQRSVITKATIQRFLKAMPTASLKILDVNLREPFFSQPVIEESLELATILKLSDEELPILASYFNLNGDIMEQLSALQSKFDLTCVAYTQGSKGSILVSATETHQTPGLKIIPVDSVGAGDSFTAALCSGLLKGWSLNTVNRFANEVAAYVCSQKGATPTLPASLIKSEIYS